MRPSNIYLKLQIQPLTDMAKKEMTLVYYHVPEDKDDPQCPNVFGVPYNKTQLRLSHIYEAFPLKGTYLFRFKSSCEGQLVWLDLPDIDAKLPTFKEKIYVKATRVSWNDSKLHSHYKDKPVNIQVEPTAGHPQQIDFFDNSHPAPKKKEEIKVPVNVQNNHIDFLNEKPPAPIPQKNHSNLLEEIHPPKNSHPNPNNSLGMGFFGGVSSTPIIQKKQQINLIHEFDKHDHGDLI